MDHCVHSIKHVQIFRPSTRTHLSLEVRETEAYQVHVHGKLLPVCLEQT